MEEQLDNILTHVKELRKDFNEMERELSKINEQLEDKPLTQKERENIAIKGEDGGAPSREIGKIIKESKVGKGVDSARVENILDNSRKTALSVMRRMAQEYEFLQFRKGSGNKGSILRHTGDI